MSKETVPALAVNHVGLTVPDVFAAIDWYGDVLGFPCIMGPRRLEPAAHGEAASALGPRFREAWQAHLLAGNGVGIELFQFIDPPTGPMPGGDERIPFARRGFWHLCVTHPDVAGLSENVVGRGGTSLSEPVLFVPGRPWVLAYVTDPWGTVLELMSHSYAEVFANWPQPGQAGPVELIARP